ncbi:MAG: hypothetical protein ACRDH9_10040 [Actinomycetota bacterium]
MKRSPAPHRIAWILVDEEPPEQWRDRASPVWLVTLGPDEASDVLAGGRTEPGFDKEEEELLGLVATGMGTTALATRLTISPRTAERRLARLRRRWGVRTTAELAALAAGRGFGLAAGGRGLSEEKREPGANPSRDSASSP